MKFQNRFEVIWKCSVDGAAFFSPIRSHGHVKNKRPRCLDDPFELKAQYTCKNVLKRFRQNMLSQVLDTCDCSILTGIQIYHGNQCPPKVWMGTNQNCGRNSTLKIPAAYRPVLTKISKCHFFFIFWQIAQKSNNLYQVYCPMIRIPCIKFGWIG